MKKLLLILLLITGISNAQETEFTFTKNGFTDFVVTKCENKTQSEIYKKCIEWVAYTYKNPESVTQAKIENEYIRIEGIRELLICDNDMFNGKECRNGKYTLEISFKDGKYKFEILKIEQFFEATNNRSGNNYPATWYPVEVKPTDPNHYTYKKGKRIGEIKKEFIYYNEIAIYLNELNKQLLDFIMSKDIPSKKNEW